uniref:Uncharacterized protein n=1 Tax=Vespula pensylvanica TaxID=30213 RepID=A0A834P1K2_VESPE|nr:hypothetical protein H0235_007619 [Vespula pensylvanica]
MERGRKLFAFLKDEDEEEEEEEEEEEDEEEKEEEDEEEEEEEKQEGRGEGWKRNKGGRTPGVLASWHPCGLIYGLQLTSLEPASSRECSTENHPTWYIATNIREQARLDGSYFANEAKDLYLSTPYSSRRIDANGQKRDWKGSLHKERVKEAGSNKFAWFQLESSKRRRRIHRPQQPRGLIGPYLVLIKAPASVISGRENEQHCSANETKEEEEEEEEEQEEEKEEEEEEQKEK